MDISIQSIAFVENTRKTFSMAYILETILGLNTFFNLVTGVCLMNIFYGLAKDRIRKDADTVLGCSR